MHMDDAFLYLAIYFFSGPFVDMGVDNVYCCHTSSYHRLWIELGKRG